MIYTISSDYPWISVANIVFFSLSTKNSINQYSNSLIWEVSSNNSSFIWLKVSVFTKKYAQFYENILKNIFYILRYVFIHKNRLSLCQQYHKLWLKAIYITKKKQGQ